MAKWPRCIKCGKKLKPGKHTDESCKGAVAVMKAFDNNTLEGAYSGPTPVKTTEAEDITPTMQPRDPIGVEMIIVRARIRPYAVLPKRVERGR